VTTANARPRIDMHASIGTVPAWTRHAGATLLLAADEGDDAPVPVDAATVPVDIDAFYDALTRAGLRYAGAFRALRKLRRGEGQAIGRIALDAAEATAPWPVVHPAVIDNALQVVAAALWSPVDAEGDAPAVHLPVGIDRLEVLGPLDAARPLIAQARVVARSPLVRADVDLADADGRRVARLRGVRLAPVDARRSDTPSILELNWERRAEAPMVPAAAPRPLFVGADGGAFEDALLAALGSADAPALALCMPATPARAPDRAARRRAWANALGAFLAGPAARRPDVVVYAWPVAEAADPAFDEAHAVATAHHRFADFWDALNGLDLDGPAPRVAVVTCRGQALVRDEAPVPAQAAAWGLVRGLMHEGEGAGLALVDLPDADTASAAAGWRCIAAQDAGDDRQFLVRAGAVHVARLARVALPAAPATPAVAAGTWLVTGARGAIGTRLVERLIAQGAPNVVCVSRALPVAAECERLTRRAHAAGANLEFAALDVADAHAVRELVDRLAGQARHPLVGVLHAAGVLEDGLLRGQPEAAVARVLAPKVAGTLNLHRATAHLPLAQFACFSSLVATIGSPGQCAYGAANAYVEALVAARRAQGLAAQAIGWGLWAGDGMADRLNAAQRHRLQASGIHALDPEEALRTMDGLLADAAAHAPATVVARLDAAALHARGASPGLRALLGRLVAPRASTQAASGAADGARRAAPGALAALVRATAPAQREAVLVARLGERLAAALQVNADRLDATTPLIEVGLDSLAATEFRATLRSELDVDIPFGRLLEGATLRDIVRAITDRLDPEAGAARAPAATPLHAPGAPRPARLAAVSAEAGFGADLQAGEL
jgi:NADP-dependent 3-hydroxy acid dehydrogenase YdfG/acyl carrier protein